MTKLILNYIQAKRISQAIVYINDLGIIETTIRLTDNDGHLVDVDICGNHVTVRRGLQEREIYSTQSQFVETYQV